MDSLIKHKDDLVAAVKDNQVLVVVFECPEYTPQISNYLIQAGYPSICNVGTLPVVHEEKYDQPQNIKHTTDRQLLNEYLIDPVLCHYSVIIVNVPTERSIETDILLALLKQCCSKRADLKLVLTSPFTNSEKLSKYLNHCPIFVIPAKQFPVEIIYTQQQQETDYLDASIKAVMQIFMTEPPGDILLFLTDQEEIDKACQMLFERQKALGSQFPVILPMYGGEKDIIDFGPPNTRKVVVATKSEDLKSVLLSGISYVVDCGLCKQKVFDPKLAKDAWAVVPISQAAATHRVSKAGRTRPGKCYRIYTESVFKNEMKPECVQELNRADLTNAVLSLKALGINDLVGFDFMEPPPAENWVTHRA